MAQGGSALSSGVPAGRTLHLIDLENLVGDPRADAELVALALGLYPELFRIAPTDHVVIAANPGMAFTAKRLWPGVCVRTARGVDGADLALLADAEAGFVAARYSRVIIGSGDHIFAPRARELAALGVVVGCVSRAEALSRDLRRAVSMVRTLVDLAA